MLAGPACFGAMLKGCSPALTAPMLIGAKPGLAPESAPFLFQLRGGAYQFAKQYPAAIAALRKAVEFHRLLGQESKGVAIGLNDLADAELDSGDIAAAEHDYRNALDIARTVDFREGVAKITGKLAEISLKRGDWSGAECLAREALPLAEKVGRQELIARESRRMAKALAQQGRKSDGLPYARRAVEIYTRLGSPEVEKARETLRECED